MGDHRKLIGIGLVVIVVIAAGLYYYFYGGPAKAPVEIEEPKEKQVSPQIGKGRLGKGSSRHTPSSPQG